MLKWIKKKIGITVLEMEIESLKTQIINHKNFVNNRIADLKEYTRVDADLGFRGNNTIILTGVYKNKGYVYFYDMGDGEFEKMVEQLKNMRDHSLIRHIDAPPQFHGIFNIF